MSTTSDLERRVRIVLDTGAPSAPPDELLTRVLSTTGRSRPRPAWLADLKEPPMRHSARVTVGSPTLRLAAILVLTMALALAAAGAVVAGASLLPSVPVPVPPPFGPAANGSLLYAQGGDIYLADADGSNARAIITGEERDFSPWFSHDGRTIAFARGIEPNYALMLADADGTNLRQVLDPTEWNAEYMPLDTELVATRMADGHRVLSMIDLASGTVRDLDLGGLDPAYLQLPRPLDGEEIIFRATSEAGTYGLFAIGTDGTGLRSIGEPSTTTPADLSFQDPVLSLDGSTIAYWSWEPREGVAGASSDAFLHLRDLDSGEELPILFDELGADNPKGDDYGVIPRFSPDGTMIVFDGCDRAGDQSGLCYGPVDGSTPAHPIGPPYSYQFRTGFEFSPDGTKVMLFLSTKAVLIDLATDTWETLPIVSDFVSWQRLAQS